jgi:hypothetical protein
MTGSHLRPRGIVLRAPAGSVVFYPVGKTLRGEKPPWGKAPVGKSPRGEKPPWGKAPVGKSPRGEKPPWGKPYVGKSPRGEKPPWGKPYVGKSPRGEKPPWGKAPVGKSPRGVGSNRCLLPSFFVSVFTSLIYSVPYPILISSYNICFPVGRPPRN